MKNLIFTTLFVLALFSQSFGQAVFADPAVNEMRTASVTSSLTINPGLIPVNEVISLKVPVINYNITNNLPSGTCKIKIGLGSKIELDPNFDLSTVNTNNYFSWTAIVSGGQVQITGDLIAPLPANYLDTVTFNIKGTIIGNSTITTNFLVTNHNTTTILSDENGNNNNTFLPYAISQSVVVPVTFTRLAVLKEACNININFDAENEINVNRYEIEISKDGIYFEKNGELTAANNIKYKFAFGITESMKSPQLFIRIKCVDKDGKFQYSEIRKVSGSCDEKHEAAVIVFPNPAAYETRQFFIRKAEGFFNGNYNISLMDVTGKLISKKRININNVKQFNYETGSISAGQYIINIFNQNDGRHTVVKWQKN